MDGMKHNNYIVNFCPACAAAVQREHNKIPSAIWGFIQQLWLWLSKTQAGSMDWLHAHLSPPLSDGSIERWPLTFRPGRTIEEEAPSATVVGKGAQCRSTSHCWNFIYHFPSEPRILFTVSFSFNKRSVQFPVLHFNGLTKCLWERSECQPASSVLGERTHWGDAAEQL